MQAHISAMRQDSMLANVLTTLGFIWLALTCRNVILVYFVKIILQPGPYLVKLDAINVAPLQIFKNNLALKSHCYQAP